MLPDSNFVAIDQLIYVSRKRWVSFGAKDQFDTVNHQ